MYVKLKANTCPETLKVLRTVQNSSLTTDLVSQVTVISTTLYGFGLSATVNVPGTSMSKVFLLFLELQVQLQ